MHFARRSQTLRNPMLLTCSAQLGVLLVHPMCAQLGVILHDASDVAGLQCTAWCHLAGASVACTARCFAGASVVCTAWRNFARCIRCVHSLRSPCWCIRSVAVGLQRSAHSLKIVELCCCELVLLWEVACLLRSLTNSIFFDVGCQGGSKHICSQ
jgi:hypothetical protein